jgi:hypothetical protein
LADITAAESAMQGAVVETTDAKQALAWERYKYYLSSIGISKDYYLDNFDRHQKHKILSAFCNAIREGRLLTKQNKINKSTSVQAALDYVAQAYKLANRPDPRLDIDRKFAFILQRQIRGYKNSDNPEQQQVAVTGSVLREFYNYLVLISTNVYVNFSLEHFSSR